MTTPLVELFKHNLWANLLTLDTCANLTNEQLDATQLGTYGNIRDTLVHIFGAEERYVARLSQQPPPPILENAGFQDFDHLRAAATASGEALIRLAEQGTPEILRGKFLNGKAFEMASNMMFIQAINHATEHRSHINTLLTHLGMDPCNISAWAYGYTTEQIKSEP